MFEFAGVGGAPVPNQLAKDYLQAEMSFLFYAGSFLKEVGVSKTP